jgi:hypothetical protein
MKAPYHPGQKIRVETGDEIFEGRVTLCARVGITDAWILTMETSEFSYVVVGSCPDKANGCHPITMLDDRFDLSAPPKQRQRSAIVTDFNPDGTKSTKKVGAVMVAALSATVRSQFLRNDPSVSAWFFPEEDTQLVVYRDASGIVRQIWELVSFTKVVDTPDRVL